MAESGDLLSDLEDQDGDYEGMLQWLVAQEQWLADDKVNDNITDWAGMSGLYHEMQGIMESLMHHQEKWFEVLNRLSTSDKKLEILPRWNSLIPALINCYEIVLHQMVVFEERAIGSSETLINNGKSLLANAESHFSINPDQDINSVQEMTDALNKEIQLLANVCQLFKPMKLLSAPFKLSNESEIILVAEKDDDDDSDDVSYNGVINAISRSDLLMYECRDLVERFETLVDQVSRNNDDVMQELEEVEAWLVHVQQWLWVEPQRMFDCHGSLTRESSMFTEDEIEHPELLMEDTPSPYMEYNDDTFSPTSPIDDTGTSNDNAIDSPGLPPPNLEYEDDEEDQVFLERPTDVTLKESTDPMDSMEEQVFTPDTPKDNGNLSFPAKFDPPVLDLNSSSKEEDVSNLNVSTEEIDIGSDIRDQLESQGSDSYVSSELSEESCSTRTEDSTLEWIGHLGLFEYRHTSAEEDMLSEEERIPYMELIQKLKSIQSSIEEQSLKKDKVLANVAQLSSSAQGPEQARELQLRVDNIRKHWETLKGHVDSRLAEMKFESAQTELLQWLLDAKSELDALPNSLLLPEEMEKILTDFKSYFIDADQLSLKHQLSVAVRNTMEELSVCQSEDEDKLIEVVDRLEEAAEIVHEKITRSQNELEMEIKLWKDFEDVTSPLVEWIEKVEIDVKERETYGDSLEEAEEFMRNIVSYRQSLREKYDLLTKLVSIGNTIVNMVAENGPAYRHVDTVVRGTTLRWQDLVAMLSNTEEELSHVLITWQEYVELYAASRDFINHIHQMAGTKPLESSQGNTQMLPKYIQLQKEFKDFQPKLDRLQLVKKKLKDNGKVGGNEAVEEEMAQLESDWMIADTVTHGSLDHLWAEHDEWLREKIQLISGIVSEGDELINVEIEFIGSYSLDQILTCNGKTVLQELQESLHEDELLDLDEKVYQIQNEIELRQKKLVDSNTNNNQFYKSLVAMLGEVLTKWEIIQSSHTAIKSAFQLMSAQLELVIALQEMKEVVLETSQVSGYLSDIERKMEESKVAFSEAKFETLRQLSYDLDTVYREQYVSLDKELGQDGFRLPSNEEVLRANQAMNNEIAALAKGTKSISSRFLLLIDWWKEYEIDSKNYWDWSSTMEEDVNSLQERTDEASPEDTPHELFHIAESLMEDLSAKETLYKSVTTTIQNIIHDFNDKKVSSDELSKELTQFRENWETLSTHLVGLHDQLKSESEQLDEYLMKLSSFSEKLNTAYSELYDEYCTAIAPNASPETIAKQKLKIEKFTAMIKDMSGEFKELQQSGMRWGFRVIPDEWVEEFREMSPALSDDNSDSGHYSVGKQLFNSESRLSAMKRMLQERSLDLELCEGKTAALLSSANELLEWVEEKLGLDLLLKAPPGEFERLLQNKEGLKNLKEDFESRKHLLERLHQLAASSKGSLSEVNLRKIETLMAQLDSAWERMEESVTQTTQNTQNVLAMIEEFEKKCNQYHSWLSEAKKVKEDCGPIGADLERLQEQEVILEKLKSDVLDHKKAPEDLSLEAINIAKASEDGTADTWQQRVQELTDEYIALEEKVAEDCELCEQAKKDMQDFVTKEESFNEMLAKVKAEFKDLLEKPKKPIGNIQETLDQLIDYCTEVEGQSGPFDVMYQFGTCIAKLYVPCDPFKAHLKDLYDQWMSFVNSLNERWLQILGLQTYWQKYEGKVKEFLNWVTMEAKRFSREVTTTDGERGVTDHIASCKTLHNTLNDKAEVLDEISNLAEILRPDDGEKPNGTKDVDSRLNDVKIHWASICQLLEETLEQLSSVYKKLCDIREITEAEMEWLEQLVTSTDIKISSQGVMEVLNEEIDKHKVYLDEIEDHRPAIEVVKVTEGFTLEHTRKSEHDEITQRVKYIIETFDTLEGSERVYVDNLEKSAPLWEEFNKHKQVLTEWVHEAEGVYNSDKLRPGNAFVTKCNLENAEALFNDIGEHKPTVQLLGDIMKQLSQFCLPDDQTFISERTNQITAHVETLSDSTKARRDLLDNRLQSWQAFPNEEAKGVQDFLDTVAMEIGAEEEEEEEELSGEELLQKLKQLEALQDQQALREAHLIAIDKSTENEQVKKALESNPDISKERNNLLQGWNSASVRLSDKLVTVKLKAEMTIKLEKCIVRCSLALDSYSTHISIVLPPSPSLIKIHDRWLQDQIELWKECSESLEALTECCDSYKDDPRVQIPKKFTEKAVDIRNRHTSLKQGGEKMANQVLDRANGWKTYCPTLKKFSEWVSTSKAELSSLRMFPIFLTEFLSLTGRFAMLEKSLQANTANFQRLQTDLDKHLFCEEREVSEESNNNNEEEGDEVGKDEEVVEYRETFFVAQKQWEHLTAGVASFPQEVKPWQEMVDLQSSLEDWYNKLSEKLENGRKELTRLQQRGDNPAVIVERSKHLINDHSANTQLLEDLWRLIGDLITPEHRENYEQAQEFVDQCKEIQDNWIELEGNIKHLYDESGQKAEAWEEKAVMAMTELPIKIKELNDKKQKIINMEDIIRNLQDRPPPPRTPSPPLTPPTSSCIRTSLRSLFFLTVLMVILIVVLVFIFLAFDPRTRCDIIEGLENFSGFQIMYPDDDSAVRRILLV